MSSMSDEQRAAIIRALDAKRMLAAGCPWCGAQVWTVPDPPLVLLRLQLSSNFEFGAGEALPTIPVVCRNCGKTEFFNLRVLGLDDQFLRAIRAALSDE